MNSLVAISLAALAPAGLAPDLSDLAVRAVVAALALPHARAELVEVQVTAGRGCPADRAEALRPVTGSGEVPLRLLGTSPDGHPCEAYGWARVRVVRAGLVATRAVAAGETLEGAVEPAEVEVRPGHAPFLGELPGGARAARALAAGAPLSSADVREGPAPGEPITVVVLGEGLELSREGRALPCTPGRGCALLPGGRRVEGRLEAGRLVLETP
ncbi:MAG TPA: SAF domain-containing protein [Anaeromyxobacter sp.]|nr:SAF domain-containing protein [Anaeromyxobacter sp.]